MIETTDAERDELGVLSRRVDAAGKDLCRAYQRIASRKLRELAPDAAFLAVDQDIDSEGETQVTLHTIRGADGVLLWRHAELYPAEKVAAGRAVELTDAFIQQIERHLCDAVDAAGYGLWHKKPDGHREYDTRSYTMQALNLDTALQHQRQRVSVSFGAGTFDTLENVIRAATGDVVEVRSGDTRDDILLTGIDDDGITGYAVDAEYKPTDTAVRHPWGSFDHVHIH